MKLKTDKKKDEKVNFDDYLALQKELDETRQKYGVEVKEGKVSRAISNFFDKREARELHSVSRKKYLIIALLTGWMGGHRFMPDSILRRFSICCFSGQDFPLP